MKTYFLLIELDEGNDEWWEDVAKGQARTKVKEEVLSCLADHGFIDCRVKVIKIENK